jgi:thioredoxin-like negative regulator of GroEL
LSAPAFDAALRAIVARPAAPPVPADDVAARTQRRLSAAFAMLAQTTDALAAGEAEDLIWALWTSHDDGEAEAQLDCAIRHIAAREFPPALTLLDALLAQRPDYVEAWNKRATLYFLMQRDRESVDDIIRTLELEPRHFGALCGLAQICLRHGRRGEALAAFEAALMINPHMAGPRAAVEALSGEFGSTAH